MAIKARIPSGQNSVRTSAMYQWDYGQTLEIEAENLPSLVEVHFACYGMTEAVVHTCFVTDVVENGVEKRVAIVAIPDRCLEQSSEITAWVYEIDGTAGRTIYSVSIPITARTRPARSESVPQSVQDTYTQLIDEVNELLEAMRGGTVNVGYASKAGVADKANTADTATSANTAGTASKATSDANGNNIENTYLKIPAPYMLLRGGDFIRSGVYMFRVVIADAEGLELNTVLMQIGGVLNGYAYSGAFAHDDVQYRLKFETDNDNDGALYVGVEPCDSTSGATLPNITVSYRKIMD